MLARGFVYVTQARPKVSRCDIDGVDGVTVFVNVLQDCNEGCVWRRANSIQPQFDWTPSECRRGDLLVGGSRRSGADGIGICAMGIIPNVFTCIASNQYFEPATTSVQLKNICI